MVSNLYLRLLTLHFFLNYLDIKAISLWFKCPLNAKSQDKIHYIFIIFIIFYIITQR